MNAKDKQLTKTVCFLLTLVLSIVVPVVIAPFYWIEGAIFAFATIWAVYCTIRWAIIPFVRWAISGFTEFGRDAKKGLLVLAIVLSVFPILSGIFIYDGAVIGYVAGSAEQKAEIEYAIKQIIYCPLMIWGFYAALRWVVIPGVYWVIKGFRDKPLTR